MSDLNQQGKIVRDEESRLRLQERAKALGLEVHFYDDHPDVRTDERHTTSFKITENGEVEYADTSANENAELASNAICIQVGHVLGMLEKRQPTKKTEAVPAVEKDPLTGLPLDLHIANFAPALCKRLAVSGMITLLSNDDGSIMMISHGITHARAAEMLGRGVQINLNQHDEFVRKGFAGDDAAQQQALMDAASASAENAAAGGFTQ